MNPETEVTFTRGRFNKVVLAVIYLVRINGRGYSRSGQLPICVRRETRINALIRPSGPTPFFLAISAHAGRSNTSVVIILG